MKKENLYLPVFIVLCLFSVFPPLMYADQTKLGPKIYHESQVHSVDFTSEGKQVLTSDGAVTRLWDIDSGKVLRYFSFDKMEYLLKVILSKNGLYILTRELQRGLALWNTKNTEVIWRFKPDFGDPDIIEYSFKGNYILLAKGLGGKEAILLEAQTGQELRRFQVGKPKPLNINCVSISHDEKYVFIGTDVQYGIVNYGTLFNLQTGREIRHFYLDDEDASFGDVASFSPDDKLLLTTKWEVADLWEIGTGKKVRTFTGHTDVINAAVFSCSGHYILTGSQGWSDEPADNSIRVWDLSNGKELQRFEGHTKGITCVAFSPDERYVLSGSFDNTARLWELKDTSKPKQESVNKPKRPWLQTQHGHTSNASGSIECVAISPEDEFVITGGSDGDAWLWDIKSGRGIRRFSGHTTIINSVEFSPNGLYLLTASNDNTARLWDISNGQEIERFQDTTRTRAVFSKDGQFVITGNESNILNQWSTKTGKKIKTFGTYEREGGILSITISTDGKKVLTGNKDNVARLYDIDSGKELKQLKGHTEEIKDVAFSSDGHFAITGSRDNTTWLWNANTGEKIKQFKGHSSVINCVAFSPDNRFALTGSNDRTARLWNIKSGREIGYYTWPEKERLTTSKEIRGVAFLTDGKHFISVSYDGTTLLWDLQTGKKEKYFKGHSTPLIKCSFSPSGRFILISSQKETSIWDLNSGAETYRFQKGLNRTATFSHDGSQVLATGQFEAEVWNVEKEKNPLKIQPDTLEFDSIGKAIFSPNGNFVVTPGSDHTGLWDVNTGQMVLYLCVKHSYFDSKPVFSYDSKHIFTGTKERGEERILRCWNLHNGKELWDFKADFDNFILPANENIIILFKGSSKEIILVDPTTGQKKTQYQLEKEYDPISSSIIIEKHNNEFVLVDYDSIDSKIRLLDPINGKTIQQFTGHSGRVSSAVFSPDKQLFLVGYDDGTAILLSMETGELIHMFHGHSDTITDIDVSPDGNYALTAGEDAQAILWDISSRELIARIYSFTNGSWAIIDKEGRYDSNSPGDLPALAWIWPDEPLNSYPVEIFMQNYFEPSLLPRILAGEKFKSVLDLRELNRIQPIVEIIKNIEVNEINPELVSVSVEVSQNQKAIQKDNKNIIQNLRLFRNGQLVGYKDGEVKVDTVTNKKVVLFSNIRLPRKKDIQQVEFSAYAYNDDLVKSATDKEVYEIPENLKPIKGFVYVLSIGVNAYESSSMDLEYAVNDALIIQEIIPEKIKQSLKEDYEEPIGIPLISDYSVRDGKKVIIKNQATKANIRCILDLLSGKSVESLILQNIPNVENIKKAQPEDMLLISFSGHGQSHKGGDFYLFASDIGTGNEFPKNAISSKEISHWLRDVDAGEILMIIDACQSAAIVEKEGFKPGPMGSSGLGQLAYNKGMRILAASQADEITLESEQIKHGLLTYALISDGIQASKADFRPRNNVITIAEWLNYGVQRVPQLSKEFTDENGKVITQIPSLFDFTKKKQDNPLVRLRSGLVKLRSFYKNLSVSQVHTMPNTSISSMVDWGFAGHSTINHRFELNTIKGDNVIIDHTTGLMWHQSGSKKCLNWNHANQWAMKLKYAGYDDWRLPTAEEASSLLESSMKNGNLFIDKSFNQQQIGIWTGDSYGSDEAWEVSYTGGILYNKGLVVHRPLRPFSFISHVRPVRSIDNTD